MSTTPETRFFDGNVEPVKPLLPDGLAILHLPRELVRSLNSEPVKIGESYGERLIDGAFFIPYNFSASEADSDRPTIFAGTMHNARVASLEELPSDSQKQEARKAKIIRAAEQVHKSLREKAFFPETHPEVDAVSTLCIIVGFHE